MMFLKSWIVNILNKHGPYGFGWLAFLILLTTLVFSTNFLHTASEFQFRTYRDGSEALVLGKIFADVEGITTDHANLGFVEKEKITKSADVLTVYKRLNQPNTVVPEDLNDSNWNHGIGTFDAVFLLSRANVAKLGYASNELKPNQKIRFPNGEIRVVTKVELNDQFLQVYYSGEKLQGTQFGFPNPIEVLESKNYVFDGYKSQYGFQGIVFSWLHRTAGAIATVEWMQFLSATLCALVVVLLCREYQISFSASYGYIFLICMIGSPWIVSVARSLYWVPALWFLPALVAMWLYRCPIHLKLRRFLYVLYFLAIFFKSLTGYEYLSTIVIFSLVIFLVDPFRPDSRYRIASSIKIVSILFILSLIGFILALLVHASIRADSILQGLKITLEGDAIKYTRLPEMTGNISRGVAMPLADVLNNYILEWTTPVVFWVEHKLIYPMLIYLAIFSVGFQYFSSNVARHRDAALIFVTALAPLSWLILMKGHSVIHVHLNYVLWYFGFIPTLIFVGFRGIVLISHIKINSYSSIKHERR